MKVTLQSTEGKLNFEGKNEKGQTIQMSGNGDAPSPMEAVLLAAAGCSSIDVEILLKKMRQDVKSIEVEVEGTRVDAVPSVFKNIHLHYRIYGDIKEDKAKKAVHMSMEQYCSVSIMLKASVEITHSFEVV